MLSVTYEIPFRSKVLFVVVVANAVWLFVVLYSAVMLFHDALLSGNVSKCVEFTMFRTWRGGGGGGVVGGERELLLFYL